MLMKNCSSVLIISGLPAFSSYAEDWFNPAFLSSDGNTVADLSRFEKGADQAPGLYHVDIWFNDEFITSKDVLFKIDEKNNDKNNIQNDNIKEKSSENENLSNSEIAHIVENFKKDETGLVPCLTIDFLNRVGVKTSDIAAQKDGIDANSCIDFRTIYPGANFYYDFPKQRLNLFFPQSAVKNNIAGYIPPEEWNEGINAGLLNYSLTGEQSKLNKNIYANLTSGINIGAWRLRHNGVWSYASYKGTEAKHYWQNVSTYLQRSVIPLKSELILGDNNTAGNVFDSVNFRGARIYSSEAMLPDSLQGYAPTVKGIASGRSTVEIRQNGYLIYQNIVQSGAFEINDLNSTASSGDLDILVKNDAGETQHYLVPYSSVPLLEREKHFSYEAVAGKYRTGLSEKNAPFFGQATFSKGLSGGYTIYGGAQLADNYRAYSVGLGQNLGDWGAFSSDITASSSQLADGSRHQGQSVKFLYNKTLNEFGTNVQLLGYRYSTRGFYTLDETAWSNMEGYQYSWQDKGDGKGYKYEPLSYHNLRMSKKGRFQLNISQQINDFGSIYVSGSQQSYWNSPDKDIWYQAGLSSSFKYVNYNISYSLSRNTGIAGTDRQISLSASIPLGRLFNSNRANTVADHMYATSSVSHQQDGTTRIQTGISGSLLEAKNLNYSLTQSHMNNYGDSYSATATLHSSYAEGTFGYSSSKSDKRANWSVAGGVLAHADGITLSQSLGTTNVLIKAPGAKGVRVGSSGSGMKTDWRGYTVQPSATMYRNNRIALDVDSLDLHTDIENNVQNVVPTEGAVVRASFVAHTGLRALFTLQRNGRFLPFGSEVTEKNSGATGIVNEAGQVYLSSIPMNGKIDIVWGPSSSERCSQHYVVTKADAEKPIVQLNLDCNT
ncbi:fimbria/pilus outer membrane usher protein [Rosenbergiella sp. S61]|uniref:Fimbria/pilus outer membrane usher protein n=1 Tax=Rosenbergiella gaditana TaxID=2726987 RepID=A0ABS5SX90_9GAMM|nr:fimbria/pilus outer membrane usher protein [Rosenbergiella gaditana]MBT0724704.1 fimbria/pilus outer membrane usher protein [Rosenbergiella gaditana]